MYTIEGSSGCVKKLSFCEEKIRIKPCINWENSIQFYLSAVFLLPEKRRYALKRKIGLSSQILIGLVLGALVGYNQLAWQLRDDPRVVVMEKQNFRYSKPEDFDQGLPDFAMTDVSFISLDLIMPPMCAILKDKCDAVCLIKPQFEAGPENVGKHGIVHDHEVHKQVIEHTMQKALDIGFNVLGVDYSPIKGGKGNIEFLIHLQKDEADGGHNLWQGTPEEVVERAVNGL